MLVASAEAKRLLIKGAVRLVVYFALIAAILFIPARRLDWPMAWVTIVLVTIGAAVNIFLLWKRNPELIVERARFTKGEAKPWDKILAPIMGVFGPLATWFVAALDFRNGWSPKVGLPIQLAMLALILAGLVLASWAMHSNKFFSSVVRIQTERGHTVVTDGPYRYLRHPGYAGSILTSLAFPVALGSFWALAPAVLTIVVIVIRSVLEDKTLLHELEGYSQYARRVKYRLLPGVW